MEGKETRFGIWASDPVRRLHHRHLDRRGQLDARELQRRSAAACSLLNMMLGEISPGRHGSGPLRRARRRDHRRLHRRPHGRAHAGAARQDDRAGARSPWSRSTRSSRPRSSSSSPASPSSCPSARRAARHRAARPHRDGLRLHLRRQQQRQRVRRAHRRPALPQPHPRRWPWLLGRFVPIVLVLALAGRLVAQKRRARHRRHHARPTPRCSSACCSASPLVVTGLTFFPAPPSGPRGPTAPRAPAMTDRSSARPLGTAGCQLRRPPQAFAQARPAPRVRSPGHLRRLGRLAAHAPSSP